MTQQRRGPRPNQARREMVSRLRESGLSFAQIGKRLHPQVSGQAVRKMFLRMTGNWVVDNRSAGA